MEEKTRADVQQLKEKFPSISEPSLAAFSCYRQGINSLLAKDYEKSREFFSEAIKFSPWAAGAYFRRAETSAYLGRLEEAVADLSMALQINPESAQAFYARSRLYRQLGRTDMATSDYQRALQLDPSLAKLDEKEAR